MKKEPPHEGPTPGRSSRDSIPWEHHSALDASFLAQVIDSVADPIFVKDRSFRYVLMNRAIADLIGVPRSLMLGKTDHEFLPKKQADFYRQKDEELFATMRPVVVEEEPLVGVDDARLVVTTTKVPLFEADGRVTHLIGMIHDITRMKRAEDELRQTNEGLERRVIERTHALEAAQADLMRKERLAVLGRLAGGVAHQIRNPLGAIKNAAYVLARELPEPTSQGRESLRIIHDEVARANQIITGLLDYARVRAPKREHIALADLVEAAVASLGLPQEVAVERAFDVAPSVMVDPGQTRSALENLIRNAIDAMPNGGTLRVAIAKDNGGGVRLTIADTGGGILAEVRDRLFEPLVTTKVVGLGLGLVTARTLIEGQGGQVTCVRVTEPGAIFEVVLPSE